jgi:glutathione S-transferase
MSYTLYGRPWAGSIVVEFVLEELGVAYKRSLVTGYREAIQPPSFAAINPLRQVPALVDGNGHVMTESGAITMLLAQRHGDGVLLPQAGGPEEADHLRWMFYLAATIYPTSMQMFHPENYTDEPAHHDGIVERTWTVLNQQWQVIAGALDGRLHLVGDRLTAADLYLTMFVQWFKQMERIEDDPRIRPFRDHHLNREPIAGIIARHESGD